MAHEATPLPPIIEGQQATERETFPLLKKMRLNVIACEQKPGDFWLLFVNRKQIAQQKHNRQLRARLRDSALNLIRTST